jgi:pyrroline-5-carboxylate reductase
LTRIKLKYEEKNAMYHTFVENYFKQMNNQKIAVLGAGNIGLSIINGLLDNPAFDPKNIYATRNKIEKLAFLEEKGVNVSRDNAKCVKDAEIVMICVKPYKVANIIEEIKENIDPDRTIILSAATGVSLSQISEMIGMNVPVFRIMPNIAIEIKESMTCISHNDVSEEKVDQILDIFNNLGKAIAIDEELMDASTVLGACGVAYVLRFIRAMMQGGIEIGFDADTAATIAYQTVKGTGELLLKKGLHPEREIDKVTTPKGCTIAGLNEMEHQGFSSSLIKGIVTSFSKI